MKQFIKRNLKGLILSSIAILLPMFFGMAIWNKIPDIVAIHFNPDGTSDGLGTKAALVFIIPLTMLVTQWVLFLISSLDKRNNGQNKKVLSMVLWIIPIVTFFVSGLMYSVALGAKINLAIMTGLLFSTLLLVIGNYLPKCKTNSVVGIRTFSTFSSEENWNRTHRLAGKFAVAGGVIILALTAICMSFIPEPILLISQVVILLVSLLCPTVYSYIFYCKQIKNNEISTDEISKKQKINSKKTAFISVLITVVTLALCSFLMFSGDIVVECSDTELSIVADFYDDISVKYVDIDTVEFRKNADRGARVFGFGSPRLLMGSFRNDEFGDYTRYSYTKCDSEIVISSNDNILVISGKDSNKTADIYNKLIEKCN